MTIARKMLQAALVGGMMAAATPGFAAGSASAHQVRPNATFIVFFGSHSATLTPLAQRIVSAAYSASRSTPVSIIVADYAGSDGFVAYDASLSRQRADAVRTELAGDGLAGELVKVADRGPGDPLASTDGAPDRENGRVVIYLRAVPDVRQASW